MPTRDRIIRILLLAYAAGSVVVALPLLLYGRAGDLAETTSGRILAAALLAMAGAAAAAARNPWHNRLVVKMLIAFSIMSAGAISYRVLAGHHMDDPARFILPVAVAAPILLAVFFPRPSGERDPDEAPAQRTSMGADPPS